MASTSNPNSKPPATGLIVPKMEHPPQDTNLSEIPDKDNSSGEAWTSEMQYVSSLAKLQKMEATIHQLRTLLSGRLMEPIVPIVNPKAASRRPLPKSPRVLSEQLSQTARASVAEVQEFQAMWRSPEMKAIWDHVDARIKQNGGQLLQPTGMWERDYDVLLEELEKEEWAQKEQQQRVKEEEERAKIQAVEGGWRTIVETFVQRNLPGVRVMAHQDQPRITVVLVKAGMAFQLQAVDGDGHNMADWRVQDMAAPGKPKTKLETAVAACLNARPRQWDLAYLLDMIASYSEVKQTPCAKCRKMTDNAAQLPSIRRPNPIQSSQDQPGVLTMPPMHNIMPIPSRILHPLPIPIPPRNDMHAPPSPIPLLIAILNPTPRPMIRNHIPPPPEIIPLTRPPPRPRERRLVHPGAAASLAALPPGPIDPFLTLAPAVDLPDREGLPGRGSFGQIQPSVVEGIAIASERASAESQGA
ncbi:hypothetical protein CNMCM7691_001484 [Aspergillus felis]|uniref:Mediator complex subunit 27-domain-containing protein n=1 Tax=Aspergillus felis TaxID=1287682 RepID=A0A8H6QZN4_9EURO|nr:hypothetical protein CNMCM7691_001484 [Aspergillus felis]